LKTLSSDVRSSRNLLSGEFYFVADVSGQRIRQWKSKIQYKSELSYFCYWFNLYVSQWAIRTNGYKLMHYCSCVICMKTV